jgi:lauroyl/myristoyl acyltransferase
MTAVATAAAKSSADNPHAPETGWMRRVLGPFHITGVFWFRFHGWGARHWPQSFQWFTVAFFSTFFFCTLFKIRRAVAANLDVVLGKAGFFRRQRRIFRLFTTFAWCLTERYERLCADYPFDVDISSQEQWDELNRNKAGMILVTAHLGNWEVGSMLPAIKNQRPVHVVREREKDPRAQRYVASLLARWDQRYVTHYAEDPQLGIQLLEALRQGEIVALQADRPRATGRTAEVTLFGRPFFLPIGPVALARAAGVPIVPVFVVRRGRRRYHCDLRPAIAVPSTTDRQRDFEGANRAIAAELEGAISRTPYQWFCFGRLWTA